MNFTIIFFSVVLFFFGTSLGFGQAGLGKELLVNGDFSKGLNGWNIVLFEEYKKLGTAPPAVRKGEHGPEVFASVMNKAAPNYVSINQPQALKNGKVYRFSAEVKSVGKGHGRISLYSGKVRKVCGLGANFPGEKTWKRYECYFVAKHIPGGKAPHFHVSFAGLAGHFAVRKLSLKLTKRKFLSPDEDGVLKELPLKNAPQLYTVAEVLEAFEADAAAANAKFKDQPIVLAEPLVAVSPGPTANQWMFSLAFGKAKLIGQKSEFLDAQITALAQTLNYSQTRFAALKRSSKWADMPAEEKEAQMRDTFPTLNASAWISEYRDGILLIGRSQDLVVENP